MDDPRRYRLTIDDSDPSWAERNADRLADVHGAPAEAGHFWLDEGGRRSYGYEVGGYCGGCGWRPDGATGDGLAPGTMEAGAITAVSLVRGPCFGTCPVYRVRLSRSGRAAYVGHEFVERVGRYQGTVDPDRFDDLVRIILQLGFVDLEREYPPPGTDMSTHELVLWSGRRPWRVVDSGSAPPEFWAMAALVDAVGDEVDWRPVGSRRVPASA
jgi:hypothetical protein